MVRTGNKVIQLWVGKKGRDIISICHKLSPSETKWWEIQESMATYLSLIVEEHEWWSAIQFLRHTWRSIIQGIRKWNWHHVKLTYIMWIYSMYKGHLSHDIRDIKYIICNFYIKTSQCVLHHCCLYWISVSPAKRIQGNILIYWTRLPRRNQIRIS